MNEKENKLRVRDIAHFWGDKEILRFFRKHFERVDYKPLRNVYLALCEIDSDFVEERNSKEKHLHALTKTCSTYAGMDQQHVTEALQFLRFIKLIDYGRKYGDGNKTVGSFLIMYKWEGFDFHSKEISEYKKYFDENKDKKNHIRENPDKGIPGYYKNIINNRFFKNIIYNINNRFFKILSKDNIDCKSNSADNFSNSDFNKNSLTRKIKQSLLEPKDFPKEVQILFKFWQNLNIVVHKKSKSRNKALQDLDKALKKYSEEEIKKSMQAYKNLLENPYNKARKASPYKVGLNQFFEFDKFTKDSIKKSYKDLQGMKSWFDLCLHDEEAVQEKFTRKTKDKNPTLTKKLTEVMQRKNGRAKLIDDQLDMCRKASNRILDLWTKKYKNKKDFNLMAKKYVMSFYRGYVLPWIEDTANKNTEKNFGVHWLLSEHFESSIEEYIKNPYNS